MEAAPPPSALHQLADLGRTGRITLRTSAIAASERQRGGSYLPNFTLFRQRLAQQNLGFVELLRPLAYLGVGYLDWCLIIGPEQEASERLIHEVLFPNLAFNAAAHCPSEDIAGRERWRNAKCDVQMMWCHIEHGGGIFVTRDSNFLKQSKRSRLEALGAGTIATPEEAVARLSALGTATKAAGPG